MREETTTKDTKDTKKNHLVTLSFVLFVPFVVDSRSCLNLCNLRNLWFLVLRLSSDVGLRAAASAV